MRKRERKQPNLFVAIPARSHSKVRSTSGRPTRTAAATKATKTTPSGRGGGADGTSSAASAVAKTGRSAVRAKGRAKGSDGANAAAGTKKKDDKQVTSSGGAASKRKKRGPYKKRRPKSTSPTKQAANAKKAPSHGKSQKVDGDDDDASSASSSSSSSSLSSSSSSKGSSAQLSVGEISVRSNTRATRTVPRPSTPSQAMVPPVNAGQSTYSGVESLLLSPSGSPSRLSISMLQSPTRPPLRLPASAAAGMSSGKQPKHHRAGCIPQFLGEDILCDTGLAFLPPDYDDSEEDQTLDQWRAQYEKGPGVSRVQMASSASKSTGRARQYRRGSSGSVGSSGSAGGGGAGAGAGSNAGGVSSSLELRYKSVVRYNDTQINLGNHRTSAASVAMQDLANLALLGSEHDKKMQLLSREEAWVALHTAKLPGVHPYGQVDQFSSLFSANYKPVFEEKLEDALASIGGQDDMLAEILCNLDNESHRQAETADASRANELNRNRKYKEKRVARRARRTEKLLRKHLAVKRRTIGMTNVPRYQGNHGLYGVDDDGKMFWYQVKDHSQLRRRESVMRERRTIAATGTSTANDADMNVEKDITSTQVSEKIAAGGPDGAQNFEMPGADAGGDDASMASSPSDSSSAASSMASSSAPSVRVRISSFDETSAAKGGVSKAAGKGSRAPGIPDAITITSTTTTSSVQVEEKAVDPLRLLVSGVVAAATAASPNNSGNVNGDLQRARAILKEFDITPLLSFSSSGIKCPKSEITGKTLTGIKFRRKGRDVAATGALKEEQDGGGGGRNDDEFIIDVRVNAQSTVARDDGPTHVLKLR